MLFDPQFKGNVRSDSLILPHRRGESGIKINHNSPQYTWRDLEGPIRPKATGAGSPALAVFRGSIREFAFAENDIVDMTFHMPHDWVPGSDLFFHMHWAHNDTAIDGNFRAQLRHAFSKGHNQELVPAEKTLNCYTDGVTLATVPRYSHRINEWQLSSSSPDATQIDTDDLEVDGLLECSLIVTAIPTSSGGAGKPFIFFADIHYLSTNIGTSNKAPNFYNV
jgi:hypothetical protein